MRGAALPSSDHYEPSGALPDGAAVPRRRPRREPSEAEREEARRLAAEGRALLDAGDAAAAAPRFEAALALDPRQALAQYGLGRVLEGRAKPALAILRYQTATALEPFNAEAFAALGDAYMAEGKAAAALGAYDRALRADPKLPQAHYHEGLTLLAQGSYGRGWRGFEWRWRVAGAPSRASTLPAWDGRPREGLRLFVEQEGDLVAAVVFCHCLGDLLAAGAQPVFRGDAGLAALIRRSFPAIETLAGDAAPPALDAAIPLGSLPGLLRRRRPDFSRPSGYLVADLRATTGWRERYRALGAGFKLGLAWRGERRWPALRPDYPAPRELAPLLAIRNTHAVSLEGEGSFELAALAAEPGAAVESWQESGVDLDLLAARIDATDFVIAPPGLVAALAGALGKPVFVLMPAVGGWLWQLKGRKLPWFPTMELRRLRTGKSWSEAASALAAEIGEGLGTEPPPRD
jgi:tetratricopeptide (TPR) repeat protein